METKRTITLIIALVLIGGAIYYLEPPKPRGSTENKATEVKTKDMPEDKKNKMFSKAKEITDPSGFINTEPFHLSNLAGKQVILVDFWTYSCINCQRTLPYLNSWQEKYGDKGLTIVGVHSPEFEFEKKKENVEAAAKKYAIKYPIVMDNDYGTWRAYGNRYWPHKYLIDIDGYVVYDHIGEGGYEETEKKIQELLRERSEKLGINESIISDITTPQPDSQNSERVGSPETYFGALRNEFLGNGKQGISGIQELKAPGAITPNTLLLSGTWDIQPEYASNTNSSSVFYRYKAKDVYLVASSDEPVTIQVFRDGKPAGEAAGEDVEQQGNVSVVTIQEDRLYKIIQDDSSGEHTLELRIENPGAKLFTFTFG